MSEIQIEKSWEKILYCELKQQYMIKLKKFLENEKKNGKQIFPATKDYFRAMDLTPFKNVKVVILGQDPYHGVGQAHGLSFSVKKNITIPPSLKNIYKELHSDLGILPAKHGFLEAWAKQGVLLLNSVLTVERGKAGSHQGVGWEQFTDKIIQYLDAEKNNVVFILWGSYAQKKGSIINRKKHFVISSSHPSPLSAYRNFFGNRPFSKVNKFLQKKGEKAINWCLPL